MTLFRLFLLIYINISNFMGTKIYTLENYTVDQIIGMVFKYF